jgi:hypothetical protein
MAQNSLRTVSRNDRGSKQVARAIDRPRCEFAAWHDALTASLSNADIVGAQIYRLELVSPVVV